MDLRPGAKSRDRCLHRVCCRSCGGYPTETPPQSTKTPLVAGAHTCDSSDQHDAADEIELFETKRQHAQVQSPPPPRRPAHSDHSNAANACANVTPKLPL